MAQQWKLGKRWTTVSRGTDGTLRVTYHSTDVVTVDKHGRVTLDTGGWRTNTTKTRMNQASNQMGLGYQVWQKDFEWFVKYQGKTHKFTDSRLVLPRPAKAA